MKISDVKHSLSSLVNRVYRKETRVLIEKSGSPVAALVSADDLNRLQQLDRDWDAGTRALARFSEAFASIPVEELEAKIDQIIAAGRAADAAERRSA
jgi:prevent-host-death family protein